MAHDLIGLHFVAGAWLSVTFAISALAKVTDRLRTQRDIDAYGIVPGPLVPGVAVALPALEGGIAIGILVGEWSRISYFTATAVLLIFAVAMAANLRRGRIISCGCRGGDSKISWNLVGRNLALAVVSLMIGLGETESLTSILLGSQLEGSDIWAYSIVALTVPLVTRMLTTLLSAPFRAVLVQDRRGE